MSRKVCLAIVVGLCLVAFLGSTALAADTLKKIKDRGVIVLGVKADYRPYGYLDASGKNVGMEIDMANDLAKRLGVKLELINVQTANRQDFLIQGKIDLILATMSENPQRRAVLGVIDPGYYAGGTNILTKKSNAFKKWEQLRGKKVCGTQGAYYNKPVAEKYGAEIVAFPGTAEAMTDLMAGNCVAFLQDSTLIQGMLGDPKWKDYEMPMPTEDEKSWHLAVPKEELGGPYGQAIQKIVIDWHKSGYLLGLEKKWKLIPSPFVAEMNKKYKGK
ncbi:MAG: transporter substrate-binding domain-containing protein [Thermodesulfobacteriota bacterium]